MELRSLFFFLMIGAFFFDVYFSSKQQAKIQKKQQQEQNNLEQQAVNETGISGNPVIQISFCQQCNYKQYYVETEKALIFHGFDVKGSEYPAPLVYRIGILIIRQLQICGAVLLFFGEHVFSYLQVAPPQWYHKMKANKWVSGLLLWFVGNWLVGFMGSTGAFEVSFQGKVIYSKLETGYFPRVEDLLSRLGVQQTKMQYMGQEGNYQQGQYGQQYDQQYGQYGYQYGQQQGQQHQYGRQYGRQQDYSQQDQHYGQQYGRQQDYGRYQQQQRNYDNQQGYSDNYQYQQQQQYQGQYQQDSQQNYQQQRYYQETGRQENDQQYSQEQTYNQQDQAYGQDNHNEF